MLIFDTTALAHFARAGRLDALNAITKSHGARHVPRAVLDELAAAVARFPDLAEVATLGWLTHVDCDGLNELKAFAHYANVLGSGARDIGEAIILAWAEVHSATAIVDERAGVREGKARGSMFTALSGLLLKASAVVC